MGAAEETRRIAARLGELSERLRDPAVSDEEAERLAREAAELAAHGSAALEAALRDAPTPGEHGGGGEDEA